MNIKWSPQQKTFLDWAVNGKGSAVVIAVAGAGKSTILREAAKVMPGQVAMVAYNKAIATENSAKLKGMGVDWKKAQAGTVHSFGFNAYRKAFQGVKLEKKKVDALAEQMFPEGHDLNPYIGSIGKLVGFAKQRALGVLGRIDDRYAWHDMIEHFEVLDTDEENGKGYRPPVEDIVTASQQVLRASNAMTMTIDYNDMVYMPLVHKVRFWQFDVVMVDEAQDTNPARRALVRAMLKKGGRVIAVGDPHQAIYGFTGADSDSLELIKQDFGCIELPLTVSYRCPQKVVQFAKQWVNHIEATPVAAEGSISDSSFDDFMKRNDLNAEAAVLCRTTKPLVEAAFALIRAKIPCKVEGRDIGEGIKNLILRWRVKSLDKLLTRLDAHFEKQKTKLLAKKQEVKLQQLEDQVDTIKVIVEQCIADSKTTLQDAVDFVDNMFENDTHLMGLLVLSTIHKAKGREWERVYWLDRAGTCPNKWARQAWQKEQEINLMYVAATRAKNELIELGPYVGKAARPK